MASQSLPNQPVTVPISIPQIDELHNIQAGLESVVWMCYQAIKSTPDSEADDATKTARAVYSMLDPGHERLGDFLDEFEARAAELRRERQELKERGTGPNDLQGPEGKE